MNHLPDINSQKNHLFKGQHKDEQVVSYFRRHWVAVLPDIFFFAFFLFFLSFFLGMLSVWASVLPFLSLQYIVFFVVLFTGFALHYFFAHLLNYAMNIVIITDIRVVQVRKTLLLHNAMESVYMQHIQDIQKKQEGVVRNFLNFGTLEITFFGAEPVHILLVPEPDRYFRLLSRIRSEKVERMGKSMEADEDNF